MSVWSLLSLLSFHIALLCFHADSLFALFVHAGGSGDAVRHAHPRLHEQHREHHEAVVRPGPQRLQPEGL